MEKITIEIWSDIVCPFCFTGKKKMEGAIAKLKAEDKVDLIWRSFQLDPDFPVDTSISTNEYLVRRKGYPLEQVKMMTAQLVNQGKSYGIDFNFDIARSFNTLDAHRLIHWTKKGGLANELKEALMVSYFTEGIDLSNTDNLIRVAKTLGLDIIEAKKVLQTKDYTEDVKGDISKSRKLGINGVPYFVVNGSTAISGAQSDQIFENTIANALKGLKQENNRAKNGTCIPNEECN